MDRLRAELVQISIHAPLAGRDPSASRHMEMSTISIHAPLAGRDHITSETVYADG